MRALAEAPQLLMHYADIEYNYIMSWDYYDKEWQEVKPQIPFKQLPMIVVDDEHEICQSMAIMTFIENLIVHQYFLTSPLGVVSFIIFYTFENLSFFRTNE